MPPEWKVTGRSGRQSREFRRALLPHRWPLIKQSVSGGGFLFPLPVCARFYVYLRKKFAVHALGAGASWRSRRQVSRTAIGA